MDQNEIRQLLPLYVAGKLDPEKRAAVEQALLASPEFQEELREWQSIQNAVVTSSEYASHHLTPKMIVDFAEGNLAGKDRDLATSHFRDCAACTEELALIQKTLSLPEPVGDTIAPDSGKDTIVPFFGLPKVRWTFALAALVAICIIVILTRNKSLHQSELPVDLTYVPVLRGETPQNTPTITLLSTTERVHFTVHLPFSGIAGTRYSVAAITPPFNSTIQLPETLVTLAQTAGMVTVQIYMGADFFGLQGHYHFDFKEEFHSATEGIEPRSYSVPFEIQLPE